MNESLMSGGAIFLLLFALLSPLDGIYLHLIKFKLQEHPDSRFEHVTHTARAILFVPTVLLLFYWNVSGPALWLLCALILTDFLVGVLDVIVENGSRARLGGLPTGEYLLHVLLTTFHVAAYTLALAAKPNEAWLSQVELPPYSESVRLLSSQLIPGALLVAALHVVLIFRPRSMSVILAQLGDWRLPKFRCC